MVDDHLSPLTSLITVRVDLGAETGLAFSGIDEVNKILGSGGQVLRIDPGEAIFEKRSASEGKVRMRLQAVTIKVTVVSPT